MSAHATYPADVHLIARAVYEVARGVIAAEESADGVYPEPSAAAVPPVAASPALQRLIRAASLDDTQLLVFRIAVAAELERGVHRVLRRLSASEAVAGSPVDAILTIVEGLGADPVAALRAFRPYEPLVAFGLVEVIDPTSQPLAQRVTVPAGIIDFLVTGVAPEPAPPLAYEVVVPTDMLCPLPVRGTDTDSVTHVRRLFEAGIERNPICVVGPHGSGRTTLLAAIAAEHGKRLLCIGMRDLVRSASFATTLARLWREVLMTDAIVCVRDAAEPAALDATSEPRASDTWSLKMVVEALVASGIPVVFTSTAAPSSASFDCSLRVVHLASVRPDAALALWRRDLPDVEELTEVASRFRLPPGRIVRAVDAARARAHSHERTVDASDLAAAIADGVSQQVTILGTLVTDSQTWDDIVLPADTRDSIRELVARMRHRHRVLDEWGFRAKLSKGLGLAALFHGPPGTGKTMVANLIAKELRQDLYQVDLSRMVSKWIGETEKNLARVFDAAEGANVMLLFDEADSLFSKRTEVKSSNDRHSNAEVNYLLQRIERFEGVCILTTNLETSIDQAFKRRLAFRVEFPMPDEHERVLLWQRMIPPNAQLADDVDHAKLARAYELAGGNIRNALLRAAFLAADRGTPISMSILERAVQLEYRDAGKLAATGSIYAR